jgi:hypothetical protein
MNYNAEKLPVHYAHVKAMLAGVPRDCWDIFLPNSPKDLRSLERNIIRFEVRQKVRDQVMAIQRLCELPLRPNETLGETQAHARLQGKKKAKLLEEYNQRRRRLARDGETSESADEE